MPCKSLTCTVEDDADRCCEFETCTASIYSSDGSLCQVITAYDAKKIDNEAIGKCDQFDGGSGFSGWSCEKVTSCGYYGEICGGFNVKVRHEA